MQAAPVEVIEGEEDLSGDDDDDTVQIEDATDDDDGDDEGGDESDGAMSDKQRPNSHALFERGQEASSPAA